MAKSKTNPTLDGKPYKRGKLTDGIMEDVLQAAADELREELEAIRCPTHQQSAQIEVDNTLELRVVKVCCDELRAAVEAKVNEE